MEVKDYLRTSGRTKLNRNKFLRARLDDLGSTIEFLIMDVADDVSVNETTHRAALAQLHDHIMTDHHKWHDKVVQALAPDEYPEPFMALNLENAFGHALSQNLVDGLTQSECLASGTRSLYVDFYQSLCPSARCGRSSEVQSLFREWVHALGLRGDAGIVVFSWINAFVQTSPNVSANGGDRIWADVFCPGSVPHRGWCLTIWNPVRQTMVALATL